MGVDRQDDGYYIEPLTLRTDIDAGAEMHLARRNERLKVCEFLRSKGMDDIADAIERGDHYATEPYSPYPARLPDDIQWI